MSIARFRYKLKRFIFKFKIRIKSLFKKDPYQRNELLKTVDKLEKENERLQGELWRTKVYLKEARNLINNLKGED